MPKAVSSLSILSVFIISALITGCGGGGSTPPPPPPPNPSPSISSLSPASAIAGSQGFTLTVNGSNFISSSQVQFNGTPRATTFLSSSQLQTSITTADIVNGALNQITVITPAPGGGVSGNAVFTVN